MEGVAEYGSMAYVVSWATLLTTLALLGFPTTIQRFLGEHRTDGHWGAAKGLARGTMAASLVTGLLVAATSALFALLVFPAGWNGITRDVLVLGVFLVPLLALSMLGTELARGEERLTVAYLPTRVGRHLLLILGVGGIAVWRSPTARNAILVLGIVLAVVFVVQRHALGRHRPAGYRAATARFAWGSWPEVSLSHLGIAVTSVALNQSGLLRIGAMLGAEEAGIYGSAWRTTTVVSFLLEATNAVVAPSIAALYDQERRDELQALLSAVFGWIFWPTLAVCVALALASGFVLGPFGLTSCRAAAPSSSSSSSATS